MPPSLILIAGLILFSLISDPVSAQSSARFVPQDSLVSPGEEIHLRVGLQSSRLLFSNRPISGERVEFRRGDRLLGTALTGGDGTAALKYRVEGSGIHRIQVVLPSGSDYAAEPAEIRVAAWRRDKPILWVELSSLEDLPDQPSSPFGVPTKNPPPRPGGVESLKRLSARYGLIYLIPEDRLFPARDWLEHHRFPPGPVGIWEGKGKLPRTWQGTGWNLRGGITASPETAEAFANEGVRAVLLIAKPEKQKEKGDKILKAADWEEAEKILR